jgi:hypothetical protein
MADFADQTVAVGLLSAYAANASPAWRRLATMAKEVQ